MTPFKSADSITEATSPHVMIDGLRRRLTKSIDDDPWDPEQALNLDAPEAPESPETSGLPAETSVLLTTSPALGEFAPTDEDIDFYKSQVSTAIENGGRLGGHEIPVPWLRMILAGLELRPIEPEMMWHSAEATRAGRDPRPATLPYEDLFPGEDGARPNPP